MTTIPVLVVDSEPKAEREARRQHGRPTACEILLQVLKQLRPAVACERVVAVDGVTPPIEFSRYRAALFSGSPLHFHERNAEVSRVLAFAEALFESGLPCFGSCAGLQIGALVAGGKIGPKGRQTELGFARGLILTEAGRSHKMMAGRPATFDVPSIHGDEVKALPAGATLLATSRHTKVQAAEMKVGRSTLWGVQYHPEVSLGDLALAVRDQGEEAIADGFARNRQDLDAYLARLKELDRNPDRKDLSWQLGIDEQITQFASRTAEIRNFISAWVDPAR